MHFGRRFYPKRLIQAILFFCQYVPGNWTHNLCAANAMLYHWATGTHYFSCSFFSKLSQNATYVPGFVTFWDILFAPCVSTEKISIFLYIFIVLDPTSYIYISNIKMQAMFPVVFFVTVWCKCIKIWICYYNYTLKNSGLNTSGWVTAQKVGLNL